MAKKSDQAITLLDFSHPLPGHQGDGRKQQSIAAVKISLYGELPRLIDDKLPSIYQVDILWSQ